MSRTALITGASSGIGRATAALLVARGWTVVGTSRAPERIPPDERVPGVEYVALDVADPASVEALAGRLKDVDALVNNAGQSHAGPLEDLPQDVLRRLFEINVFAPVRLAQLALPAMRERGSGRIVMVGSMNASFPMAYRSLYIATKAAIKGFAEAARAEYAPFGVWLTTVEPGSISTGISERRVTDIAPGSPHHADYETLLDHMRRIERAGPVPEKIAEVIVRALEADRPRQFYALGSGAPWVFLVQRLIPRSLMAKATNRKFGLKR
ncbi:SDR family oxidoreductase [Symbioplanes lichenis]|uniref:SDR family oxidoreductase n=1 Tax=Symbioplanes lichenis TaxID=1629072 RepID=UPI0027398C9D|nr:SDR family oxidoreductase [Actinoplanes lichenis]